MVFNEYRIVDEVTASHKGGVGTMRTLSKRHKKYLDKLVHRHQYAPSWDVMHEYDKQELERIGDYETLWCDVQRYLEDKFTQLKYGGKS